MPSAIIYYIERMYWRSLWGKKNAAVQAAVRILASASRPAVRPASEGSHQHAHLPFHGLYQRPGNRLLYRLYPCPWSSPVPVGCAGFSDGILNFSFHGGVSRRIGADIILVDVEEEKCRKKDVDEPCPFPVHPHLFHVRR